MYIKILYIIYYISTIQQNAYTKTIFFNETCWVTKNKTKKNLKKRQQKYFSSWILLDDELFSLKNKKIKKKNKKIKHKIFKHGG